MGIGNEGAVVFWVMQICTSFFAAVAWAIGVSGIFHVISLATKIERLRFNKVFPFVFIMFVIFYVIHIISSLK